MKTDWKKEYEELDKRYYNLYEESDNKWETSSVVGAIVLIVIASLFLFSVILALCGAFDSLIEKLNIDKDALVKEHVLKHYPEYEDCNIKYDNCIGDGYGHCSEGVKIYCNKLNNRDGLKVSTKTEPTEVLYFDDLTLEDILLEKINEK